jgi:hypothetical protein
MKNRWICSKDYFATWGMQFLPIEHGIPVDKLLEFIEEFLQIAEEAKIFHLSTMRLPSKATPIASYIELLRQQVETQSKFSFLSYPFTPCLDGAGIISYYDKEGSIKSSEIQNVGELMKQIHFDDIFTRNVPPVEICGLQNISCEDNKISRKVIANIYLNTNIWFPKVINYFSRQSRADIEIVDNSQLATQHTPRLNRFLEQARRLTLSYDGSWWLTPGEYPRLYSSILTETGIRLDMDDVE